MRLKTLHDRLQDLENSRGDQRMSSAATAACVECFLIIKMHEQIMRAKLLPVRLERSDLDHIIQHSE
jgi:hypothetical protein